MRTNPFLNHEVVAQPLRIDGGAAPPSFRKALNLLGALNNRNAILNVIETRQPPVGNDYMEAGMAPETVARLYPLYSTTFLTYRLSPLFHSSLTLDNTALRSYASQFRDVLTGEVLRGVRVGMGGEDEILARVGALKTVRWSLLKKEEDWEPDVDETQIISDDTTINDGAHAGISVEIIYERSAYSAILLYDIEKQERDTIPGFSHYPLMLTRMPGPLRETFLDFLAATFDTRASVLSLPSTFLADAAEKYLSNLTSPDGESLDLEKASRLLRIIIKDIVITLSFDVPGMTSSLKTMEVMISKEDSWSMMQSGKKLLSQVDEQKSGANVKATRQFTRALRYYIDAHLGLKLDDSRVKISRVACGAFVLGTEGKMKLTAPPTIADDDDLQNKATRAFIAGLTDLASGGKSVTLVDLT